MKVERGCSHLRHASWKDAFLGQSESTPSEHEEGADQFSIQHWCPCLQTRVAPILNGITSPLGAVLDGGANLGVNIGRCQDSDPRTPSGEPQDALEPEGLPPVMLFSIFPPLWGMWVTRLLPQVAREPSTSLMGKFLPCLPGLKQDLDHPMLIVIRLNAWKQHLRLGLKCRNAWGPEPLACAVRQHDNSNSQFAFLPDKPCRPST